MLPTGLLIKKIQIMDVKVHFVITLLIMAFTLPPSRGEIAITPGHRVAPSTPVSIQCAVNRAQYPSAGIIWKKQTGGLSVRLGADNGLDQDFSSQYSLSLQKAGSMDTFVLVISDVQYEDSGTYICQREYAGSGGVSESVVLAICEDTDTQACKCMEEEGWNSPTCFEQPEDAQKIIDGYKGAVIGVVVCLVIAIVYGVIVSIMLSRDCINRMKLKAKRKLDAMQNDRNSPGSDFRHLNDSVGSDIHYDAVAPAGASMYQNPESNQMLDSHPYGFVHSHKANIHHHGDEARQQYDNKAYEIEENGKSYNQLKPSHDNIQHQRGTPTPSGTMSDSSSDSWGHGARPKVSQHNTPQHALSAADTRYQDLPKTGAALPRQTGRNPHREQGRKTPQSGAQSPRITSKTREPGRMDLQQHVTTTPTNTSHNKTPRDPKRQAPSQPEHDSRARYPGPSVPAKYDTYEGGLQTISQQMPANPTPQSTHSEHPATSPSGVSVEMNHRGAYTDVTHDRNVDQSNGYGVNRGHYTQPRKLDYVNGRVAGDTSKSAYVGQTDTMI